MIKLIIFFVTIVLVVSFGFLYLSGRSTEDGQGLLPQEISDATKSERCAKFEEVEYDVNGEEIRTLGYGSRIKQVLNGCF